MLCTCCNSKQATHTVDGDIELCGSCYSHYYTPVLEEDDVIFT